MTLTYPSLTLDLGGVACLLSLVAGIAIGMAIPRRQP